MFRTQFSIGCKRQCETQIARVPEGSGRVPEGLPEAGYLFLCYAAIPEGSGRFPEGLSEGCFVSSRYAAVPEGSGRVPEERPEGSGDHSFINNPM